VGRSVGWYVGPNSGDVVSIDCLDLDLVLNFTPASATITRHSIIAAAIPMYPKFLAALIVLAYYWLAAARPEKTIVGIS